MGLGKQSQGRWFSQMELLCCRQHPGLLERSGGVSLVRQQRWSCLVPGEVL